MGGRREVVKPHVIWRVIKVWTNSLFSWQVKKVPLTLFLPPTLLRSNSCVYTREIIPNLYSNYNLNHCSLIMLNMTCDCVVVALTILCRFRDHGLNTKFINYVVRQIMVYSQGMLEATTHGSWIKAIELCLSIDLSQCCWRQAVEAHVFKDGVVCAIDWNCVGGVNVNISKL